MTDVMRYPCCHEAAHAVLRVLIGDKLIRIQVDPVDPESPFATPMGERGATIFRSGERTCVCGLGSVTNDVHSGDEDPKSAISVNASCNLCLDDFVRRLTAILVGGISTRCLVPEYHQERDGQFDKRQIEELFCSLPHLLPLKTKLLNQAKASAISLMQRERKAIDLIISALMSAEHNTLDGVKAEQIVKNALVSSDFPATVFSPRT